ncbi:MAG: hypothetical protein ABR907_02820 [Terracidiphilus sp.]|jgi:hypothetical protein
MNADDQVRLKKLLQEALPPTRQDEPEGHLWPAVVRRLDADSAKPDFNWAWFDGALAAALVGAVALFPAAIPVALYYL